MIEKTVLRNVFWMVFEKGSRLVIGVAVSGLMARSLGPSNFGELNYYISLLSIASVLSSLGLNRIIVREVANHLEERLFCHITVITSFYCRLLVSLLIWAGVVMASYLITEDETLYVAVIFASLFFISFDVFDFYAQGASEFRVVSLCRLCTFIIISLVKVAIVYYGGSLLTFVSLVLIEYLLTAIFFYLFLVRKDIHLWQIENISAKRGLQLVKESWPEIIAGFGAILFMRLDQIFLQLFVGSTSVGIYSAATRITEAWYFMPTAIIAATFPKLVAMRSESYEKYFNGIKILTSFLIMLSLSAAIFFTLTADWIVAIIFGPAYAESANVIVLHTWGAVFLCMGTASGSWLVAERKLALNLWRNLFGLIVCAIANLMLVKPYGVTGAAISTVLGLSAAFYFFDLLHPQLRAMFFLKTSALSPIHIYRFINSRK